jgi:hypothetical protein
MNRGMRVGSDSLDSHVMPARTLQLPLSARRNSSIPARRRPSAGRGTFRERIGATSRAVNLRTRLRSLRAHADRRALSAKTPIFWRRGRDSNSRSDCSDAGFQDRCIQPLCHLSVIFYINTLRSIGPHYYPQFWGRCSHFVSTLPHQTRESVARTLSLTRDRVRVKSSA